MASFEPTAGRATGRLKLGDAAIFTCLVGGVAAISTAGIALPVKNVGFPKDWMAAVPLGLLEQAPRPVAAPALAAPGAAVLRPETVRSQFSAAVGVPAARNAGLAGPALAAPLRVVQARPTALSLVTQQQLGIRDSAKMSLPPVTGITPGELAKPVVTELTQTKASDLLPGVTGLPLEEPASASLAANLPIEAAARQAVSGPQRLSLISGSEVAGFDLGKIRGSALRPAANLAKPASGPAGSVQAGSSPQRDVVIGDALFHQVGLTVGGSPALSVAVRIGDDMKPSIKVADLLGLVANQLDPESAARFAAAASAQDFVSLATLREAGFSVAYNAAADSISIAAGN